MRTFTFPIHGSRPSPKDTLSFPSHGLNPGLGNAGHVSFPSAVTAAPTQVVVVVVVEFIIIIAFGVVFMAAGMANTTQFKLLLSISLKSQAARMANYTRFSPSDWSASNIDHYNSADASRLFVDRKRKNAVLLVLQDDVLEDDVLQEPVGKGEK